MINEGVIQFVYLNKLKTIEFSLNLLGYGGLPMLMLKDKNNHHHTFIRSNDGAWRSLINGLKWPEDFLSILYELFEEKYQEAIKI